MRASLVPAERAVAGASALVDRLEPLAPARTAGFALLKHFVTDRERMRGDIRRWGQAPAQYNEQVKAAYAALGRQGAPIQYHTLWSVQTAPMPQYILTPGFRRLETVAGHEMALLMAGQKSPAELVASLQEALSRPAWPTRARRAASIPGGGPALSFARNVGSG